MIDKFDKFVYGVIHQYDDFEYFYADVMKEFDVDKEQLLDIWDEYWDTVEKYCDL